jgi:hypothetical protein
MMWGPAAALPSLQQARGWCTAALLGGGGPPCHLACCALRVSAPPGSKRAGVDVAAEAGRRTGGVTRGGLSGAHQGMCHVAYHHHTFNRRTRVARVVLTLCSMLTPTPVHKCRRCFAVQLRLGAHRFVVVARACAYRSPRKRTG